MGGYGVTFFPVCVREGKEKKTFQKKTTTTTKKTFGREEKKKKCEQLECYFSEPDESLRIVAAAIIVEEATVAVPAVEAWTAPSFLTVASLIDESVFWSQLLRDEACISIDRFVNW